MGNANRCVVAAEKSSKCAIYEGLRFRIEGGRCFVENQDIGILDQSTSNGNALLLSPRELSTPCPDLSIKAIRLGKEQVLVMRGGEKIIGVHYLRNH